MGGVWKPIFPPQKPQSRQDKALNPQGPLGGTQRYTQLARSPPWENRSRCPRPSHPGHCPARGARGPGMETLKGDFQAQRNQVPGPHYPQRGIWSLREGHIARGFPRSSPPLGHLPLVHPGFCQAQGLQPRPKTQDPIMAPSSISK